MSVNHFPNSDFPETLWWTQQPPMVEPTPHNHHHHHRHHHHQPFPGAALRPPFNFNLNRDDENEHKDDRVEDNDDDVGGGGDNLMEKELLKQEIINQKEPMFEKPLTPSDVGKLNRLVIPKQHAEKYFPLGANGVGDSVEKGLLLSFEDELGKSWRFRYSYWNSSQSYVLTKGWSRFVKEKRLDAGDIVMFERSRNENDRFFIGWRRRNPVPQMPEIAVAQPVVMPAGGGGWTRVFYAGHPYPPSVVNGPPLPYQPDCLHAAGVVNYTGPSAANGIMQNQTAHNSGNCKTLRLFGVNLECQSNEPIISDGPSHLMGPAHYHPHHHHSTRPHLPNHLTHMQDINSPRDVNHMSRFHQG